MERLTKRTNGTVWYSYKGDSYSFLDMDGIDILHVLNKLAKYEDEAEQRERGCEHCNSEPCADNCMNFGWYQHCVLCDAGSCYVPEKYCPNCGRKLV